VAAVADAAGAAAIVATAVIAETAGSQSIVGSGRGGANLSASKRGFLLAEPPYLLPQSSTR
jgi:hypothetical protein